MSDHYEATAAAALLEVEVEQVVAVRQKKTASFEINGSKILLIDLLYSSMS